MYNTIFVKPHALVYGIYNRRCKSTFAGLFRFSACKISDDVHFCINASGTIDRAKELLSIASHVTHDLDTGPCQNLVMDYDV
jgi:hypothetical protein